MDKKRIPDSDLKLLIDFLRLAIKPDLEFEAVYQAVVSSFSVQSRLFKALSDRKEAFVDVRIKRKPQRIILNFACLPESLVSAAFEESEQMKKAISESLPVSQLNSISPVDSVQDQPVEPEIIELELLTAENKRRGRGKAKKITPVRSPVSVLIDDLDIAKLNDLVIEKDLSFSQLVRLAIKDLLKKEIQN